MDRHLERCHIVPQAAGGFDEPSNLVLLCKTCHLLAPDVADPDEMWNWIDAQVPIPVDVAQKVLTGLLAAEVQPDEMEVLSPEYLDEWFRKMRDSITTHSGVLSRSTYDWLARRLVADTIDAVR